MEETKDTTKKTTTKKTAAKKENVKTQEVDAFAAISLILGVASMITWLFPILGISISIPGLAIGIVSHETKRSNYSLIGLVMCLVGITLAIIKNFCA